MVMCCVVTFFSFFFTVIWIGSLVKPRPSWGVFLHSLVVSTSLGYIESMDIFAQYFGLSFPNETGWQKPSSVCIVRRSSCSTFSWFFVTNSLNFYVGMTTMIKSSFKISIFSFFNFLVPSKIFLEKTFNKMVFLIIVAEIRNITKNKRCSHSVRLLIVHWGFWITLPRVHLVLKYLWGITSFSLSILDSTMYRILEEGPLVFRLSIS